MHMLQISLKSWHCFNLTGSFPTDHVAYVRSSISPLGKTFVDHWSESVYKTDVLLIIECFVCLFVLLAFNDIFSTNRLYRVIGI